MGDTQIKKPQRGSYKGLKESFPQAEMVDRYADLLKDLYLIRNPKLRFNPPGGEEVAAFISKYRDGNVLEDMGSWFYFPWSKQLVHYLPEEEHQELRTARNRLLITDSEQDRFYAARIAIAGMSVGSHIAAVIAMTGGAKYMKLADPDTISGDNLNRIRVGFNAVGTPKLELVARLLWEINPYLELELFPEGITQDNAEQFVANTDVIVEETDNPYWKFRLRELARARKIPVVMGTDNGDGIIVDIERYDLNPGAPLLNGLAGNMTSHALSNMKPKELPKIAARIAGADRAPVRMLESVAEVGRALYSWPQLGTAANMCGTVVAYLVRRIILKTKNIKSGRYEVNLDSIFESDYGRKWFARKLDFFKFVRRMSRQ